MTVARWILAMLAALAGVSAVMQDGWPIWARLGLIAVACTLAELEGQLRVRHRIAWLLDILPQPSEPSFPPVKGDA